MVFNNGYNDYTKDKYYFQKDKNPININEVDTLKIVLSSKIPYGKHSANKYYIAYFSGGFKPLHIIIKDIKLYTNRMNDCNWTRTHNHLVHKRTLNHLAKLASLAKWLSVRL